MCVLDFNKILNGFTVSHKIPPISKAINICSPALMPSHVYRYTNEWNERLIVIFIPKGWKVPTNDLK